MDFYEESEKRRDARWNGIFEIRLQKIDDGYVATIAQHTNTRILEPDWEVFGSEIEHISEKVKEYFVQKLMYLCGGGEK